MFHNSSLHNECKILQKNIFEFSDFLVNILHVTDVGARMDGIVTYHDSCSGLREVGIKKEPRLLLENVKGLEIREMEDVETCCGFGGTFSVKYESIAVGMAEQKVLNATKTGAKLHGIHGPFLPDAYGRLYEEAGKSDEGDASGGCARKRMVK